jgi:hypothetical protein
VDVLAVKLNVPLAVTGRALAPLNHPTATITVEIASKDTTRHAWRKTQNPTSSLKNGVLTIVHGKLSVTGYFLFFFMYSLSPFSTYMRIASF